MPQPRPLRIAAVSVRRPIFRGDQDAAWAQSVEALRPLVEGEGGLLEAVETAVTEPAVAARVAAELRTSRPDLLLIQATTFATADCFAPLLDLGGRVGLWAVPEPTVGGPLPLNSLCGVNFLTSLRTAPDHRPAKWFYGLPSQPACRARLLTTLRAVRAAVRLAEARVVWIGGPVPTFDRFDVAAEAVGARFGTEVERVALDDLWALVDRVGDDDASRAAAAMAGEVSRCTVPSDVLVASGRLDVALRELVLNGGYDAAALRCWPEIPDRCGTMPCACVARLFDAGCPTACEGDVLGALSCLALAGLSERATILMDLSHKLDDHLVFWHCGNGPQALAAHAETVLQTHFNRPDTPAVRAMALAAGDTTMLRFTGLDQAAVFDGVWAAADPAYEGVTGLLHRVCWGGEAALTPGDLLATVLDRKLPHHFAFTPGQWSDEALELCAWLGLDLVEPSPERAAARRDTL